MSYNINITGEHPEQKKYNYKHFLYVPFTGLGLHGGYRGDDWLRERIKIFKQFVLPSLVNQTNHNFMLWFSWRPEDIDNPQVQEFADHMAYIKGCDDAVFTFGGLCFWDDKYENDNLKERLEKSLPALERLCKDADWVLMTIQPSDDIYTRHFVERIQNTTFTQRAVGFRHGYIMDYRTKEIAEYNPDTSPPFYTIIFPKDVFLDPAKHLEYTGAYKSHEYVKDHIHMDYWEDRGFCVGTHGRNISTTFNHPYKGRILEGSEKDRVMLEFSTYFTEPLPKQKLRWGLALRKLLNGLPFQEQIRKTYYKLPKCLQRF